jgi:hypothetical protein
MAAFHPRNLNGRVLSNVTFRGFGLARRRTDAETLDGIESVASLQQEVRRNGLILAGLRAETRQLEERQMQSETPADVLREIQAAASRLIHQDPRLLPAQAVSLALEQAPELYERHEAAVHRARGEAPLPLGHVSGAEVLSPLNLAIETVLKADPTLTREQAYAKALDSNPALYKG